MKQRPIIERSFPLLDLDIDRSEGDGRIVVAYAATFDQPYPVSDQWGDYDEEIDRAAFNRVIGRGIAGVQVLFNHGLTAWGTPSERYSMPLGTPLEVRPDGRGLLTRTAYARTDLGDEVLELVRSGAIRGQSFRGPVYRSSQPTTRAGRKVIRRLELGLKEYGPTPFPVNAGADMVAVRSALLNRLAAKLTPEELDDLLEVLGGDTAVDIAGPDAAASPAGAAADPQDQPAVEAPVVPGPSLDMVKLAAARARARGDI